VIIIIITILCRDGVSPWMKHGGGQPAGQHTTKGHMFGLISNFQWVLPGSRVDTDGKHTDGVLDFHTQKTFDLCTVADPMGGGS
jgi:hypothetical protein